MLPSAPAGSPSPIPSPINASRFRFSALGSILCQFLGEFGLCHALLISIPLIATRPVFIMRP